MRGLEGRAKGRRAALGRWAALALFGSVLAAAPARAEDGGFFGFLRSALGGDNAPAPAASPPQAATDGEPARPLTVRRSPKKLHAGLGRARLAHLPEKTGPVSIFDDPTLRSGDAVMTKDGMKVFAGGRFSPDHPYNEADFVSVSASKTVAPSLRKTVIELNKLPPS